MLAAFQTSPTPYVILMVIGFVVGALGQGMRSRPLTAFGIALVFLATVALPLATNVVR